MEMNSEIKKIFHNFSFVGIVHVFNMIIPFIVYPILIRRLGAEIYGEVVLYQSIVLYLSLFINFGLNSISVKEISHCNDNHSLNNIFCSIYLIRFIFLFVSATLYFTIGYFFYELTSNLLFVFSFGALVNDAFFPSWFFQGNENVKMLSTLILLSKIIAALIIIFFVHTQNDAFLIPLCYTIGYIISIIVSLVYIFNKYNFVVYIPTFKELVHLIKQGIPLFISQLSLMIKDKGVVIILGLFFAKSFIAYYDLASKVITAYFSFYNQFPIIALPRIIKSDKPRSLIRILLLSTILIGGVVSLFCILFADKIVIVLGSTTMLPSVRYLRTLSILLILVPLNTLINFIYISRGNQLKVMYYTIFAAVLFCLFSASLYIYDDIIVLIYALILASLIELMCKTRYIANYLKILKK